MVGYPDAADQCWFVKSSSVWERVTQWLGAQSIASTSPDMQGCGQSDVHKADADEER